MHEYLASIGIMYTTISVRDMVLHLYQVRLYMVCLINNTTSTPALPIVRGTAGNSPRRFVRFSLSLPL